MPFVVCTSKGGPYDDAAFVAGTRFQQVWDAAGTIQPSQMKEWYVETPLTPQMDLIAMKFGLTITTEPWDEAPDEWTLVTMGRPA